MHAVLTCDDKIVISSVVRFAILVEYYNEINNVM